MCVSKYALTACVSREGRHETYNMEQVVHVEWFSITCTAGSCFRMFVFDTAGLTAVTVRSSHAQSVKSPQSARHSHSMPRPYDWEIPGGVDWWAAYLLQC